MVVKKKSTKKVTKTPKKVAKTTKKTSKTTKKATKTVAKKASKIRKKSTPKKAIPTKKTSNRGRPRKEFKLKHKRIAEKKPATTGKKENAKITMHTIPKTQKIKNSRDRSILYLFVFSVILFAFSLGVSFLKKNQVEEITDNTAIIEEAEEIVPAEETIATSASEQLKNLYIAINSKNFEEVYEQRDSHLKRSSTIRTYFSEKRLTKFIDNLNDGIIHIDNIQEEILNEYSTQVTYTVEYTLLAGSTFMEEWSVKIIEKEGEQNIASIRCETSGCSRMPFFNPKKYNIK